MLKKATFLILTAVLFITLPAAKSSDDEGRSHRSLPTINHFSTDEEAGESDYFPSAPGDNFNEERSSLNKGQLQ